MSDHMDCTTFEASLAEFLDGGLDDHTYAACEQHRDRCAACRALVADLDAIVASA
jgi:anti-sigma factor RsiW